MLRCLGRSVTSKTSVSGSWPGYSTARRWPSCAPSSGFLGRPGTGSTTAARMTGSTASRIGIAGPIGMRAPAGHRKRNRPAEEGLSGLGRAEDPREAPRAMRSASLPSHQHGARGARPARTGAAPAARAAAGDRHRAVDHTRAVRVGRLRARVQGFWSAAGDRTDNGVPFASAHALYRLSKLAVMALDLRSQADLYALALHQPPVVLAEDRQLAALRLHRRVPHVGRVHWD